MNLYLLRHAESENNALGLNNSVANEPLSNKGFKQAQRIVTSLGELNINQVLCSSLPRARQTVQPFIETTGLPIEYSDVLVEGQLVLNGVGVDSTSNKGADSVSESAEEFIKRSVKAAEMIRSFNNGNILIVTHGHMIREIINILLDTKEKVRFPHDNCGITKFVFERSVKVDYINRPLV
ncbi:histidine phosphatase family protein [Reinekea forsetii]|nr:histidine phosphatase family protein [Reinekea forsetii]